MSRVFAFARRKDSPLLLPWARDKRLRCVWVCVWVGVWVLCVPAHLAASAEVCIQQNGPRSCYNSSRHAVAVWSHVGAGLDVTGLHPNLRHCWWWVGDASIPSFLAAYPEASVCTASVLCQGHLVHLFTSPSAVSDIDELQCFRLRLTLFEYGRCFLPRLEKPRRTATCSALTKQMQFALDDKNLGKWALLQQCRVPWLPCDRHVESRLRDFLLPFRPFCFVSRLSVVMRRAGTWW